MLRLSQFAMQLLQYEYALSLVDDLLCIQCSCFN